MEILGHLLFALLYLGLAALPFLLVLCVLRFLGTVLGRGMADGLRQPRAPRPLVLEVAPTVAAADRRQDGQLFWTLVWLAAAALMVLALVAVRRPDPPGAARPPSVAARASGAPTVSAAPACDAACWVHFEAIRQRVDAPTALRP
jgi:hypothetical protein